MCFRAEDQKMFAKLLEKLHAENVAEKHKPKEIREEKMKLVENEQNEKKVKVIK